MPELPFKYVCVVGLDRCSLLLSECIACGDVHELDAVMPYRELALVECKSYIQTSAWRVTERDREAWSDFAGACTSPLAPSRGLLLLLSSLSQPESPDSTLPSTALQISSHAG